MKNKKPEKKFVPSFPLVIKAAGEACGVPASWLDGWEKKRSRTIVAVRSLVCMYLRDQGFSLKEIASVVDREYTDVIHLLSRRSRFDAEFFEMKKMLKKCLKNS